MKDAARIEELSQGITGALAHRDAQERGMTATLYDLTWIKDLIDDSLESTEGELTAELEATFDEWGENFDRKVEDYALVITEQKALAAMIEEEADKLRKRAEARLNLAKRLTERLQLAMEHVGRDKVRGVVKTVALQKNPPSVVEVVPCDEADLRNVAQMAPEFVTRKPEVFSWNREAIKTAYKAGTLPADVAKRVTVVQGTSLRIR